MAEIAEIIGVDEALKLSAAWPGIRLHVPNKITAIHAISVEIGLKAAQQLCAIYGGTDLVIPMATRAHRQQLHLAILQELQDGASASELARKYGLHQFTIYRLSSEHKKAEQGQLF
ncbi:MAG: hypothetical protein M0Q15_10665 [Nevskia sp.]|nr:hypothetical protein [Nevskia sp.]